MTRILWNAARSTTFKFRRRVTRRSIFASSDDVAGGLAAAVVAAAVAEVKRLTCSWSMLAGDLSDSLIVRLA
jgi:TPP-dependent trihydroxycyclohexane-1,2-dione (THcHDO) dehydratase